MSFREWEKKVKGVKKSNPHANPYAVVNSRCRLGKYKRRRRR